MSLAKKLHLLTMAGYAWRKKADFSNIALRFRLKMGLENMK